MVKMENTDVYGWDAAIRGMRNPMNSWDKSDSDYGCDYSKCEDCDDCTYRDCHGSGAEYKIGPNDLDLMKRLASAGSVHAKYRRMITVSVDITAPLYWWKEFDTYKVGTVANSCSTMHKIHDKEFTLDDFSHEHIGRGMRTEVFNDCLKNVIDCLNEARLCFLDGGDKIWWWQMIQLLPSSYNQKRTILMNYEVLVGMYRDRKNHKLDEWHTFCEWIEKLPYSEIIIGD